MPLLPFPRIPRITMSPSKELSEVHQALTECVKCLLKYGEPDPEDPVQVEMVRKIGYLPLWMARIKQCQAEDGREGGTKDRVMMTHMLSECYTMLLQGQGDRVTEVTRRKLPEAIAMFEGKHGKGKHRWPALSPSRDAQCPLCLRSARKGTCPARSDDRASSSKVKLDDANGTDDSPQDEDTRYIATALPRITSADLHARLGRLGLVSARKSATARDSAATAKDL